MRISFTCAQRQGFFSMRVRCMPCSLFCFIRLVHFLCAFFTLRFFFLLLASMASSSHSHSITSSAKHPMELTLTRSTSRMEFDFDAIGEEDSPFPEVRASVSNIDDPDMPAMTIRMWFVGLLLCMTSR